MRTKLIYALSALMMAAMMLVTSCKKDDPVAPAPPITIPAEFTLVSLDNIAINKEIKFTATTDWSITLEETTKAAPSWLRLSQMSGGAGDVTLNVEVDKNTSIKERSANVIVTAGGVPYTIAISQKAGVPEVVTVAVTGVTLNQPMLSLVVGTNGTLTATVNPAEATNKAVTWTSSDTAVATVDEDGKVTALSAGPATITVTTNDGGKTATCAVTVTAAPVAVTGVTLNQPTISLVEGTTETLIATVNPAEATNKTVTWTSSDTAVATVDADGKVTAVSAGPATITVTTNDGGKTATCAVTVTAAPVAVTGVTVDPTATISIGATKALTATVAPAEATNKNVTWESSDTTVVTVVNGVVTGVKTGSATITVTTVDGGKSADCIVTVQAFAPIAVTGVTLSPTSVTLEEGETQTLTKTITPALAKNRTVTWTSSDTAVATVDEDGKVTALSAGPATITVTTNDGGKTATCAVTVTAAPVAVTGVTLNQPTISLVEGTTETLIATVNPAEATNKTVTWTSSDTAVATVDEDGKVTAVSAGPATITVTTNDGGKTATCAVTVTAPIVPVTSVWISKTVTGLVVGTNETLKGCALPIAATNREVVWTSSNPTVATVGDTTGLVEALEVGTAIITITSKDGAKQATCEVKVTAAPVAPTSVSLNKSATTIFVSRAVTLKPTVYPTEATNKEVTWASSKPAVATVNADGTVKGVEVGTTTITVTTKDGSKTTTCEVTVVSPAGTTTTPPDIVGGEL